MAIMASRSPVLVVKDLNKSYGDHTVIQSLSFTVHAGEAVALTGRNGAGKSTVLRCVVGADRPTSGTVEVLGKPVSETSAEFRRSVATVIDDMDFFPDLSVVEHLDLLARAHGLTDADALVDEVLEEVQLVPQSGQLPGTLSTGQRRRLGLATAFVRPRKLLVLDEPEARLDVEGIAWLGKRLGEEMTHGLAILMASHEPSLLEALGARTVALGGSRG
ncbi:MAG: ABC transporter ATP-binding protein [Acidipropionibacterium sp.]|nr:ABC transporter ATP-binding protein [Acidipropionibacterium sp.]